MSRALTLDTEASAIRVQHGAHAPIRSQGQTASESGEKAPAYGAGMARRCRLLSLHFIARTKKAPTKRDL